MKTQITSMKLLLWAFFVCATVSAYAGNGLTFPTQPKTTTAGATMAKFAVQLTNASGGILSNQNVAVTLTLSSGSISSGTNPENTDKAGKAQFADLVIDTAGSYTMTATATGYTSVTSSSFNITAGAVTAAQSTVAASPTSVPADGLTTSTITVTLNDAYNNPVSGKTVTLAQTSGPGSPTISAASGPSSSSGVVTFTVKSTTAGADVFTATDTTDSVQITQTATVTFTAAGVVTAAQSTVAASPTSVPADGSTTSTITVTLKDVYSNPVSNKTVTLAKTSGPGSPTISAASGPSSSSGVVTFTVKSTTAGADVFTATDATDSVQITQTATITFNPGTLDHFAISAISSPQTVGTPFTIATITAQDANNNTVTNYTSTVTFGGTAGVTGTSGSFASGLLNDASVTATVSGSNLTVTVTDGASPTAHTGSAIIAQVNGAANVALTWNGGDATNNSNWSDGTNWAGGLAPTLVGDSVVFAGVTGLTPVMDSSYTVGSLTFDSSAGSFTLTNSSDSVLTVDTAVTNNSTNAQYVAVPVTLGSAGSSVWTILSNGPLTVSGPISDSGGGLTISGNGILELTGSNTFTGNITNASTGMILGIGGSGQLSGGAYAGNISNNGTFSYGSSAVQTLSGSVSGTGTLIQNGPGTLTLSGVNTYSGSTAINTGTLALASAGSIAGTSGISIGSGGTFDVSSQSAYSLGNATLAASGTSTAAAINGGASGGSVSLGSQPITLTYDGTDPALSIFQGTLVLSNNAFTINSASALAAGTYILVQQASGSITDLSGTYPVPTGTAIGAGATNFITVSGGNVILTIQGSTTTTVSSSTGGTNTYGQPVTFSATVTGSDGGGTVAFYADASPSPIPGCSAISLISGVATTPNISSFSAGTHAVSAVYSGDAISTSSSDLLIGGQTVNPLAVIFAGDRAYDQTATALAAILSVSNAVGGDDVYAATGSAVLAGANVGAEPITSVGTLALGGMTAGNYTLTGASGSVTITNPFNAFSISSSSLAIEGTNFVMCWQSVPGVTYTVLTNGSLATLQPWPAAGDPITATSTTTCFTLPGGIAGNTATFLVIKQQ